VTKSPPHKKRRLWTWLKRLLLTGCLLLVLVVVFHAPLLRWVIAFGVFRSAEKAGITLTWQVAGSVTRDLKLTDITASGQIIESATIGEFAVEYDGWRALRTRDFDVISRLVLKDVDAEVDLRNRLESKPKERPRKTAGGKPPPLVWPHVIDIENVNAEVTLADGAKIIVRGLSLRVGEGMPGIFEVTEFKMEPGDLKVENVMADVAWGDREITISGVGLPRDAQLKTLRIDLQEWSEDAADLHLEVGLGEATVMVEALAKGLFSGERLLKADVQVRDLTSNDWKMPDGVTFGPANLDLQVEGDPTKPISLSADGKLGASDVQAAGALLDRVSAVFEVKDGLAKVGEVKVTRGSNEIVVSLESKLAEDVMKSPWTAKAAMTITDASLLLVEPLPVRGLIEITADAEGIGATPTKATARLQGTDLSYDRYRLPQLAVSAALDGKEAKLSVSELGLGAGNRLEVNATMEIEDTMPVTANWDIQVEDPELLIQTVNLPPMEQSLMAKVHTSGKASFKVNDPMNGNAEIELRVREGRFGEAPLPVVEVSAKVAEGVATVEWFQVIVDETNRVDLTGTVGLREPWGFDMDGVVNLPELNALNGLLAALEAPQIESGALSAELTMEGEVSPWRGEGRVTLDAAKVKVAGMPEEVDVDLKTSFAGTTATMESMQIVLGPWKLLTHGIVTDKEADLSELSFWQEDRQIVSGRAKAAFDWSVLDVSLTAKELPIHEVAAAAGVKGVPEAILSTDIAIRGLEDANVSINLKDVKTPGMPKSIRPAQITALMTLKDGKLVLDAKVDQKPLQTALLTAEVPMVVRDLIAKPELAMDLPLNATLDMPESDLSFVREFAPDVVRSVPAKMRLNATVSGTVKAPQIDSTLELDVAEVNFVSPDMPSVRDVKVRVRTHEMKAEIEEVSAMLAGGRVNLVGSIDAAQMNDPSFNLQLEAQEALVFRNPTSSLRANGHIACVGSLKAAHVSGEVMLVRGRVFREVNLLPNVMRVVRQSDPLPPLPRTSKAKRILEFPPMFNDWTFDLQIKTRDPILLDGNLATGAFSANVNLGGAGAEPQLTGVINADRLLLRLPFSLLKITKGVATMNPENPLAPRLDIRGESRIGSYDIALFIYGDATDPKTRFTSSPPLSEANIVTLIGTGMTLDGDSAQLASEAMTRAAMLVVMETYRKVFNKEKRVSDEPPKLHLSVNPSGSDRADDSMQAMYEVTPNVRVTGRFTQSGQMKALLGYVLRFGKAARAMEDEP